MFSDRKDAAQQLATSLSHYKGKNPLIVAIPRGGVPLGKIIADKLNGDFDVILVHKIGHPKNREYAIGAIDEQGNLYLDPAAQFQAEDLASEIAHQRTQLQLRRDLYTPLRPPIDPSGRIVIIVDDGVATGWTIKAAIASLKSARAKTIVVAVPVGPADTISGLYELADAVICLEIPALFQAVGQFYENFSQVSDEEVANILRPL